MESIHDDEKDLQGEWATTETTTKTNDLLSSPTLR
jgi:hypothetical protein